MATIKAQKLKEDAHRQNLENLLKSVLASQEQVVKQLKALTARVKALEGKAK
jgi:hypothetical protein